MIIRPKVLCTHCGEKVDYTLESSIEKATHREVEFEYLETRARCDICGNLVYVPAINDKNWYERHKAYYDILDSLEVKRHG